jgi:hypothetical protein
MEMEGKDSYLLFFSIRAKGMERFLFALFSIRAKGGMIPLTHILLPIKKIDLDMKRDVPTPPALTSWRMP